jgi:hypothetical protein
VGVVALMMDYYYELTNLVGWGAGDYQCQDLARVLAAEISLDEKLPSKSKLHHEDITVRTRTTYGSQCKLIELPAA